jgi:hypothetical protein
MRRINLKNLYYNMRTKVNKKFNLHAVIAKEIQAVSNGSRITVADFGAGLGNYWAQEPLLTALRTNVSDLYLIDTNLVDGEIDRIPNVNIRRLTGIVPDSLKQFDTNMFDVTIALDLIEHLPKHSGFSLLYEMDRITSKTSLIFTPNGFVWQPPFENNPYMAHLSGWNTRDFKILGWRKVIGLVGLKKLFGPYGKPKGGINSIFQLTQLLTLPLIWFFPSFSFAILAIKYSKNPRVNNAEENF